jgi:hypothetical protein
MLAQFVRDYSLCVVGSAALSLSVMWSATPTANMLKKSLFTMRRTWEMRFGFNNK